MKLIADHEITTVIDAHIRQLDDQMILLYQPKPGCACTQDWLCAHHAAVWAHLDDAREDLELALEQLQNMD